MHKAMDLGMATAYTFAGRMPHFKKAEKITFNRAVEVGDLVKLTSRVIFASDDIPQKAFVVVEVRMQIIRPEECSSVVSNHFLYTFSFSDYITLRRVLPRNIDEAVVLLTASSMPHAF